MNVVTNMKLWKKAAFVLGLIGATVFCSGCACCGWFGKCGSDIDPGSVPAPPGTYTRAWEGVQISQARNDQTAIYRADFVGETTSLSPGAINKMELAIRDGLGSQMWIVEPSGDLMLDRQRLLNVTERLQVLGIDNPEVEISKPTAIGLPGAFAESSLNNLGTPQRSGANSFR